jgi:hypothetical protein
LNTTRKFDVIVIGAGAAGLMAAGHAAELGAKVLLIEKMRQPGRKLLITGKGRCNITNVAPLDEFMSHIYPDSRFLRPAFSKFFWEDTVDLFNKNGLETVVERGGRIFPATNKSSDVVNTLLKWLEKNKVIIVVGTSIIDLIITDAVIKGVVAEKEGLKQSIYADRVIVCTGGKSYPATGSTGDGYRFAMEAGHTVVPLLPSLVPLETSGNIPGKLEGLILKNVKAIAWTNGKKRKEEFGEMFFTSFGLSGPIILTLSRFIVEELQSKKSVEVSVDLKPALNEQKLDARLIRDLNENGKRTLENIFRLWLPVKMIPVFLELLSLDPYKFGHQVNSKERRQILSLMKDMRFKVTGVRSFKEAIITAGGVSTNEIDPRTMESKLVRNLYFAGEVLDLDADTGGYNLQIAWSTGWLAGEMAFGHAQSTNFKIDK